MAIVIALGVREMVAPAVVSLIVTSGARAQAPAAGAKIDVAAGCRLMVYVALATALVE